MISSVYSYYIEQYGNRINSKQDFNSRKDNKNFFSKVAHINSRTPAYKLDLSESALKYAIDLKENAMQLNYAIKDLSDDNGNGRQYKQKAHSSDSDKIDVNYIGNDTANVTSFDINVEQIATNQVNTGNYLPPNSKFVAPGTYTFELNINNLTYEFEFDVDKNETNNQLQNKLNRLINRSNVGISSKILTNSLGNTAISISSDATGIYGTRPLIFSITSKAEGDSSKDKNSDLISLLGLSNVEAYPKNAIFSINGAQRFSQNNNITINKSFLLNLKDSTPDKPVTISMDNDTDSIVQNISEMVDSYNSLYNAFIESNSKQFIGSDKLKKEFQSITKEYGTQLKDEGINISDNGTISLDKELVKEKCKENNTDTIIDNITSFKDAIQKKAEYITLNPMNYVNNKIVAYKNPRLILSDVYNMSAYSGIMFNDYI